MIEENKTAIFNNTL